MQNGGENWSVLLQQILAMLFIMRSVNSTTVALIIKYYFPDEFPAN